MIIWSKLYFKRIKQMLDLLYLQMLRKWPEKWHMLKDILNMFMENTFL